MAYSDEEIRQQLRLGEDSAWEFKAVRFNGDRLVGPSREDWADEIVVSASASNHSEIEVCITWITRQGNITISSPA